MPESTKPIQISTSSATIDTGVIAKSNYELRKPHNGYLLSLRLYVCLFHTPGFEVFMVRKGIDADAVFVVDVELAVEHRMHGADVR